MTATYGCHSRAPLKPGFWVAGRVGLAYDGHGAIAANPPTVHDCVRYVKHRMSTDCRHDSAGDPKCAGCPWQRSAEAPVPLDGTGGLAV